MKLIVRAPVEASLDDVEEVLADKKQWILETLYGLAEQGDPPLDKEYLSGEKLRYNGRRYRPQVSEAGIPEPELRFDGTRFELVVPESTLVNTRRKQQAVVDWYVREAAEKLPERSSSYIEKLGLGEVDIEVKTLRRRWGEYRPGKVFLHWRLILAPGRFRTTSWLMNSPTSNTTSTQMCFGIQLER